MKDSVRLRRAGEVQHSMDECFGIDGVAEFVRSRAHRSTTLKGGWEFIKQSIGSSCPRETECERQSRHDCVRNYFADDAFGLGFGFAVNAEGMGRIGFPVLRCRAVEDRARGSEEQAGADAGAFASDIFRTGHIDGVRERWFLLTTINVGESGGENGDVGPGLLESVMYAGPIGHIAV